MPKLRKQARKHCNLSAHAQHKRPVLPSSRFLSLSRHLVLFDIGISALTAQAGLSTLCNRHEFIPQVYTGKQMEGGVIARERTSPDNEFRLLHGAIVPGLFWQKRERKRATHIYWGVPSRSPLHLCSRNDRPWLTANTQFLICRPSSPNSLIPKDGTHRRSLRQGAFLTQNSHSTPVGVVYTHPLYIYSDK